jgi:tetratricopeptide (TPR) repeat protein
MKKQWWVAILVVISLALLAYWNAFDGEFVLDDRAFLVDNPQLSNAHSLSYFFSENVWHYSKLPDAYSASYRPLYFLTLWLSDQLSLATPLALHLFSILLHVVVALLVLLIIKRLVPGISPLVAGIGAGLFALHPVHVEAVAWVSAFIHPLTTMFLLVAFLAHDHSRDGGGTKAAAIALSFYALALLSNEMAVAFPLFILIHDQVRYGRSYFVKNLPYFIVLAGYMLVRSLVLGEAVPLSFSNPEMWLRLPVFLLEYIRQLLLPWPQPLYLQMPDNWGLSISGLLLPLLFIAALAWLRKVPSENRRTPILALIWIAIFLLPPMAAAFSPDARFALRSLYLPSVGIAVLLAWVINTLPALRKPTGLSVIVIIFLLALAGTTAANRHWSNDGHVYSNIITWNPAHHAGYLGLGKFLERQGETDLALIQYELSTSFADLTVSAVPMQHWARLLGESGDNKQSLELFNQLTRINPTSVSTWTGTGNNLWALGRPEEAVNAYLKAYEVKPDDRITCYNLVLLLNQLGRTTEADQFSECAQATR